MLFRSEVGARWAQGDLGIAYEHASTAAVEELLIRCSSTFTPPTGPSIVVACAELDPHALGARAVAAACALDGLRVAFLGPSLPAPDLEEYLEIHRPMAVALSCSVPTALAGGARSIAAAHRAGIPVVGGGSAGWMTAAAMNSNCGGRDHVALYVERSVIGWARDWFGLPAGTGGILVGGTSMAHLLGLGVAQIGRAHV